MDFDAIRLLILDVDGVLTDGGLVMSENGVTAKAFQVRDGSAIRLWQRLGGTTAIVSGRQSEAVRHRAAELGIESVRQGCDDKLAAYSDVLETLKTPSSAVCYLGDDLPDVGPMRRCGFPVAVANAAPRVKQVAAYVARSAGGDGAVAETVELILRKQGRWS